MWLHHVVLSYVLFSKVLVTHTSLIIFGILQEEKYSSVLRSYQYHPLFPSNNHPHSLLFSSNLSLIAHHKTSISLVEIKYLDQALDQVITPELHRYLSRLYLSQYELIYSKRFYHRPIIINLFILSRLHSQFDSTHQNLSLVVNPQVASVCIQQFLKVSRAQTYHLQLLNLGLGIDLSVIHRVRINYCLNHQIQIRCIVDHHHHHRHHPFYLLRHPCYPLNHFHLNSDVLVFSSAPSLFSYVLIYAFTFSITFSFISTSSTSLLDRP